MRTTYRLPAALATACLAGLLVAACRDDANRLVGPTQVQTSATQLTGVPPAWTSVAYVANRGSNFVSVLYGPTAVARIPVGKWPVDLAIVSLGPSNWGTKLYVTNQGSNSVSVVDMGSNRVVKTIPVGAYPHGVVADYHRVYVANQESNTVTVIDAVADQVVATIPVGKWPYGVAVTYGGDRVLVANYRSNTVSVIDRSNHSVIATVAVGMRPVKIVAPDGPYPLAYVTNEGSNTVSVIDLGTNTVVATIPVGLWPNGIAAEWPYVYVTNVYGGSVSVIDMNTNTVVNTMTGLVQPIDVGFAFVGNHYPGVLFVSNQSAATVTVFDGWRGDGFPPIRRYTAEVGKTPWGIAALGWEDPPRAHQPPPFGGNRGRADKDFVEVCHGDTYGTKPPVRIRVVADETDSWYTLAEGECRDVWYNPLSIPSQVEVMLEPPSGYEKFCWISQIGPRDQAPPERACPERWRAVVQSSLDVGYLVEFTIY